MKRFLAMTMASMMAVTSANIVFAETKSGDVVIEYDDSKDLEFDTVTVTTVDADTFDFSLDPGKILNDYDTNSYNATDSVFFTKVVPANFKAKTGEKLYKKSLAAIPKTKTGSEVDWTDVVTAVNSGTPTVATGYYVWTPDTTSTAYTVGKPGKEVELTDTNIGNWFNVADDGTITLKPDYKAGTNVCDGNIYRYTYTEIADAGITDSTLDPITNYVTLANDGESIATYGNLYKDANGTAATANEVEFTPASTENKGETTPITVINKSTKKKTVTATVTMSNASDISFKNAKTSLATDTDAAMYIAVTDGTTTKALAASEDGATATAEYTVDLEKATVNPTVYQTTGKNDVTGGHNYAQFNSPTTTFTDKTFYIEAAISGTTQDAKDAWKAWAEAKNNTDNKMPAINVVYNVADKVDVIAVASSDISVSVREISVTGLTDTPTVTKVTIGGTAATLDTDYTVDTETEGTLKVALKNPSTSNRNVVIEYTIDGVKYSATATVAGQAARSSVADVVLPASGTSLEIPVTIGTDGAVPKAFHIMGVYADGDDYDLLSGAYLGNAWGATYNSSSNKIVLGASVANAIISDNRDRALDDEVTTFKVVFSDDTEDTFKFTEN